MTQICNSRYWVPLKGLVLQYAEVVMVRIDFRRLTVLPVLAVCSVALMTVTVMLATLVSNKFIKEQVAYQRNFLLVEPGIDDWTNCISLIAFAGSPLDKSLAYRASMVSFPVSIKDAPCDELEKWIDSDSMVDLQSETYSRYWFGSSAIVRILSLITAGLDATRTLIFTSWSIVFAIYFGFVSRRVGLIATALFIGPLFLTTDFSSALKAPHISLSFLCALMFGIGALMVRSRFKLRTAFLFGIWLPFFDPLTHPLLYFFVMAGPMMIESAGLSKSPKLQAKRFVEFGLFWIAGYVASWLAKWTFAALYGSGFSVFRDAFSQVRFRSMGKVDDTAPATLEGVSANFSEYLSMPFASSLIGVIVVYTILSTIIRLAQQQPINLKEILFFFVVAISPVAFYVLLKSHSVEHSWMTYRTMSISLGVSLACMFAKDRNLFAEPVLRVPSPL